MRFLVDAQLPPALARWLSSEGYDAEHVFDFGFADAEDGDIWSYAAANGSVIITKDEDFALLRTLRAAGPTVVWLRIGNTRKAELLRWFQSILPEIVAALERGETLVEVS